MINEIRNELLLILSVEKSKTKEDRERNLDWLLERFETDIREKLIDLEYEKSKLEENLETLEYVKKMLKEGEK